MKELIGRQCKIRVNHNGREYYFSAQKITSITETHITFLDKFNKLYCYRLADIDLINTEESIENEFKE